MCVHMLTTALPPELAAAVSTSKSSHVCIMCMVAYLGCFTRPLVSSLGRSFQGSTAVLPRMPILSCLVHLRHLQGSE